MSGQVSQKHQQHCAVRSQRPGRSRRAAYASSIQHHGGKQHHLWGKGSPVLAFVMQAGRLTRVARRQARQQARPASTPLHHLRPPPTAAHALSYDHTPTLCSPVCPGSSEIVRRIRHCSCCVTCGTAGTQARPGGQAGGQCGPWGCDALRSAGQPGWPSRAATASLCRTAAGRPPAQPQDASRCAPGTAAAWAR